MDLGLRGRAAAVAASSRGLGRACAEALAREGVDVAICSRGEEPLREAEEALRGSGVRVHSMTLNLEEPGACERFVDGAAEAFGRLDILVANNGGPPPSRADAVSMDTLRAGLEISMLTTVRMIHTALPHMRKGGWGRIIAITSQAAKQPMDGLVLSNTARAGLSAFLKTLATEVAAEGITVNSVLPGAFETDRILQIAEQRAESEGVPVEETVRQLGGTIPVGRVGQPSEMGALVAFLASEHAAYLTGVAIPVDGGTGRGTF